MAGCAWNSPPAGRNGSSEAHLGKGSIAYADGKFYCLYEGDGEAETEIALIDASPERVERKQRGSRSRRNQRFANRTAAYGRTR